MSATDNESPAKRRFVLKLLEMSEPKTIPKKIKSPWVLGLFVLFLLTFLILLQSSNLWKNFSIETAGDTLLL